MTISFDPSGRSVMVPVEVFGLGPRHTFRCVLDTGSTQTVLPATTLRGLGYDLSRPLKRVRIRSATGVVPAPVIRIPAVSALDRVRTEFLVAAHDFPLGITADGLLGLDFFRGFILKLDFIRGRVKLFGSRWWQFWR